MSAEDVYLTQRAPPPILSEETVGGMLLQLQAVKVGQARCEEQNARIDARLASVSKQLTAMSSAQEDLQRVSDEVLALQAAQANDERDRERAAQTWRVLKTIGAILLALVVPVLGWLGSRAWDDYAERGARLDTIQREAHASTQRIERHESAVGHEGLRATVGEHAGQLGRIDERLDSIEDGQRQILEHLRSRR